MMIAFILLGGAAALELLVHVFSIWARIRSVLAYLSAVSGAFALGYLMVTRPNAFTFLVALLGAYRVFNMLRVTERRMHERYLRTATLRTSFILLLFQAFVSCSWWAWERWGSTGHTAWAVLAGLQAAAGGLLLASVVRNIRRTAWPAKQNSYSDRDLPSITVAIPARNETEDLHQCLQSIIASDYPKLEIIVLDDCSQNRRTPEIIREFAHDGVRFIQGQEPGGSWLPKNSAYARLTEEASGSYILFCGVDIRFSPGSLRHLVSTMLDRNKQMVSLLPLRRADAYSRFSMIQAMRYWWELVPPRRLFRRPPVLSSCWIVKTSALEKAGGFKAVARAIVPEALFAKELIKTDGYSFLRSGESVGIESVKHVQEQRETAIRMRYPQVHRRPEQVAIITLLESAFLVLPFVLVIAGFWISIGVTAHLLAALASALFAITYTTAVLATHVNSPWFSLLAQPLTALADIALLHYSMWKYEFSVVDWKGRNVCVPVMHVEPHLPKN
jgi:chlorobactene glucosyltransferase